jgi:hypothetical protein
MSAKRAGEFFSFGRNQLIILMGLLNLNRSFFRWGLIMCVVYANTHFKWPCMFLVTVRHWPH